MSAGSSYPASQPPACTRCGASTPDRVYVGFIGGETYCTECLTPEQIELIGGVADALSAPETENK